MKKLNPAYKLSLLLFALSFVSKLSAQADTVSVDWNTIISPSRTTPTLRVVEKRMIRPSSGIHTKAFEALKN